MCYVKVTNVSDGLNSSERVANIDTINGLEEIAVSGTLLKDDKLLRAAWIGIKDSEVLIELPTEATSGRRRVWVKKELVDA